MATKLGLPAFGGARGDQASPQRYGGHGEGRICPFAGDLPADAWHWRAGLPAHERFEFLCFLSACGEWGVHILPSQ
jgi:hypothetical protein